MRFYLKSVFQLIIVVCLVFIGYMLLNEIMDSGSREEDAIMRFRNRRFLAAQNRPPREGPGENGASVILTPEEKEIADKLFPAASFNVYASDKMAMDRSIPDGRMEA